MPRGDWSNRPAIKLGIVAAFLLSVGSIWWAIDYGWSQEASYEESARNAYAERAKHGCYDVANSKSVTAAIKQSDAKPCTPSEKGVEENDNRRDYADLVAQRTSALWAKIMGIAAVVGVALSLLGIALVAITFYETRKANSIAKETMIWQSRAYVKIEDIENYGPNIIPEKKIIIPFHIINYGVTPAVNLGFKSILVVRPCNWDWSMERLEINRTGSVPDMILHRDLPHRVTIESDSDLSPKTWIDIREGKCSIFAKGAVYYRDVFGQNRETKIQFEFNGSEDEERGGGGFLKISHEGNSFT